MDIRRYPDAELGNQDHWDELAEVHARSYDIEPLLRRESLLDEIQREELGPVDGKTLLHLQCHIGTDTLSWALLGAEVTGVDISAESLKQAETLAARIGVDADFVHCSVYDLPHKLERQFDIVYTSVGILCWLSDLRSWGQIIRRYLKPDGVFYIMESHPILGVFDDETDEVRVRWPYFGGPDPVRWPGDHPDYADSDYRVRTPSYEWQWTMSDVINALIEAGLDIEYLHEHDRIHWQALPCMVREGRWWLMPANRSAQLPLAFSLRARPRTSPE